MHFLITGGAGFIGSHITEKLLSDGHRVTVVDNLSTGSANNLPDHAKLRILRKDILSCQTDDFSNSTIDGCAHLAATPSVAESWIHPLAVSQNNISATVRVIELCQVLEIPRLVFTSSAAVYGNISQLPILEECLTQPVSPYGLHKLVGEQYVGLFAQHAGFSALNLRLFNVFGPRQQPNSPYSGVISIFTQAMQRSLPIAIYGDGLQTRDFIYVQDVAAAFAKALTVPLGPGLCVTCNIGTGNSTSLHQLIEALKECFPNWTAGIQFLPARSGDVQHSRADITKAASLLKFTPEYSIQTSLRHNLALLASEPQQS